MSSLSMLQNVDLSLETLPVELHHRIFDYLDSETILFSVRLLSRLFQAIVKTYPRYVWNFESISQKNFHLFCRLIHPENVISLTLADEQISGQINLFNSSVYLQQFTRLRSITLIDIDEDQLHIILERINMKSISTFSSIVTKHEDKLEKTTIDLLSTVVGHSSLRRLKLNEISDISWPHNCTIEHLTIYEGVYFDDICTILSNCPYLKNIIIIGGLVGNTKNLIGKCFEQLISLSIERSFVSIETLELFLASFPSLKHLKLIGEKPTLDGKRWEDFIQTKLPRLDRFEFFFSDYQRNDQTTEDLQSIISSFQTPFWIDYKKWFVTYQCTRNESRKIYFYSIPICSSFFEYYDKSVQRSFSTFPTPVDNDLSMMKSITPLFLYLDIESMDQIEEKKEISTNPLFPQVTELRIDFNFMNIFLSIEYLSSLINISKLTGIKLYNSRLEGCSARALMHVIRLLEQMENLSSLTIYSKNETKDLIPYLNDICQLIPIHIKYLTLPIFELDQVKTIFHRCQFLSFIELHLVRPKVTKNDIMKWFDQNTIHSISAVFWSTIQVWIGKRIIYSDETLYPNQYELLMNE